MDILIGMFCYLQCWDECVNQVTRKSWRSNNEKERMKRLNEYFIYFILCITCLDFRSKTLYPGLGPLYIIMSREQLHPKLRNINFHNVTQSLISQNPREHMFVVQISLLIFTILSLTSQNLSLKGKPTKKSTHTLTLRHVECHLLVLLRACPPLGANGPAPGPPAVAISGPAAQPPVRPPPTAGPGPYP